MEKRGRMPATAEEKKKKKKKNSRKQNGAQLPLALETSPPFIEMVLKRSPTDSQECG